MSPVTKRTGEQGQISIFFSASLVVLVSIIAFVINVGLFVKAKINLQNATDASAFAGAAVQARQLSNIAYLNWEMRNVFKEWMFKYYVIGNLNITDVMNTPPGANGIMSFRMEPDVDVLAAAGSQSASVQDPYNFPSVCIHLNGSTTNICRRFAIPGLPEFGSSSLPGAEEASRAFQDILIGTKVNDCIERTNLNMLVALTWAYNIIPASGADPLTGQGPAIMANRQGAWPRAVELAMRIRNLEKIVNRESTGKSICMSPGATDKINCQEQVDNLSTQGFVGDERFLKAFYSGYRNIGGNYDQDEMKSSFTLTEIPPQVVEASSLGGRNSASYLLSPEYSKQYLDLKLQLVNYSTFFSAMIPRATSKASGACDVSKAAIPVPGYPLGFYKNPQLITYYAVKGEAVFQGMFNPFQDFIKLTAYAAAKPMGGRIGPMLFYQDQADKTSRTRTDPLKKRSVPYITSLDVLGTVVRKANNTFGPLGVNEYWPGVPLPVNSASNAFWVNGEGKAVGGLITQGDGVQFGIPNLVYDYQKPFDPSTYSPSDVLLHIVKTGLGAVADKQVGLYSKYQFGKFKGSALGSNISTATMEEELARIKAPTSYEAANYLIPTPDEVNKSFTPKLDSFGVLSQKRGVLSNGVQQYSAQLFAPLYDSSIQDVHWRSPSEVVTTIRDFMRIQTSGMNKYRNALNIAAKAVFKQQDYVQLAADGSKANYEKAASGISDIDFNGTDDQDPRSCASLNGKFRFFYMGNESGVNPSGCSVTIEDSLRSYFAQSSADPNFRPTHYSLDYSWHEDNFAGTVQGRKTVFSAYTPGPYTGIGMDGVFNSPIPGSSLSETMRRNFYSAKFVSLDALINDYNESSSNFLMFSEGDTNSTGLQVQQRGYLNPLQPLQIGADDLSSIKH